MQLNIKDPKAHRMAQELARLTGESMTQAVVHALETKLAQVRAKARPEKADVRAKNSGAGRRSQNPASRRRPTP